MQTDVYIKIINEKMNKKFWMAGFLVIPKVYAVIASPFSLRLVRKSAERVIKSKDYAKH